MCPYSLALGASLFPTDYVKRIIRIANINDELKTNIELVFSVCRKIISDKRTCNIEFFSKSLKINGFAGRSC